MRIPFVNQVTWYLIAVMFLIGIAPKAEAGFSPSEIVALSKADRFADIGRIRKTLETKMISERLERLGLTQDEVNNRLAQLNDQQVHKLALQLDDLKVGKDDGLGLVIGLLVIAILVVLLLQLTGHRVIITR